MFRKYFFSIPKKYNLSTKDKRAESVLIWRFHCVHSQLWIHSPIAKHLTLGSEAVLHSQTTSPPCLWGKGEHGGVCGMATQGGCVVWLCGAKEQWFFVSKYTTLNSTYSALCSFHTCVQHARKPLLIVVHIPDDKYRWIYVLKTQIKFNCYYSPSIYQVLHQLHDFAEKNLLD
jgi:hypothetical protein